MTFEDFLALPANVHAEWVNGEAIIFTTTTDIHADVVVFLVRLIADFVDEFHLGRVRTAPFGLRLQPDGPLREPDVMFVATDRPERLGHLWIEGAPDLVIEVISDDSTGRDWADKFYEYQEGGVPEYWIYDPRPGRQRLDGYALGADGRYLAILPDDEGRYRSRVLPGFWLRLDWLTQVPPPTPRAALDAILASLPTAPK